MLRLRSSPKTSEWELLLLGTERDFFWGRSATRNFPFHNLEMLTTTKRHDFGTET
jgi:hypothetical protein